MIDIRDYKAYLRSHGSHLGEVRKNEADMIMNATFTGDIAFRRVYILSKEEGWHFVDAKFSKHAASSIAKDEVDSYLQFRPKVHYPVGTYVFIPDDTKYELRVSPVSEDEEESEIDVVCPQNNEDPVYDINGKDPLWDGAKNLWMIVGRTDSKQFVQYLVLKCNYKFRWVTGHGDRKELKSCWGCVRNANSYTSGVWNDYENSPLNSKEFSVSLLIAGKPLEPHYHNARMKSLIVMV